ncbi:MAG: C40 family peptidase [Proteobacteria bacterium]|nr:C40 family peptidase [Pseudomonadota bacterium]
MMKRRIFPGMVLVILFASMGFCREGLAHNTYNVRKGDTLSGIARKQGVSVSELKEINRLRSNVLKIGQKLALKKSAPPMDTTPVKYPKSTVNPELAAAGAGEGQESVEAWAEVERQKKDSEDLLGMWSSPEEPKLLVKAAMGFLGAPYRLGGFSLKGIDCSGLVKKIYAAFSIDLPRTAYEQSRIGMRVSRKELVEGDLLFFNTRGSFGHVGIYIGDNKFIHAASRKRGVRVSSLNESYFNKRFVRAVRLKGSEDDL